MSKSQTLEELVGTIEMSSGEFVLLLARCNYDYLRTQLVQQLEESYSINFRIIFLSPEDTSLYRKIETLLGTEEPDAVMVLGLESVTDRYTMLTGMNKIREEFRKHFHFPLILWVDDERLSELIRISPDFTNWGTTFHFQLSQQGMLDFLRQKTEEVFEAAIRQPAQAGFVRVAPPLRVGMKVDLVDEIQLVLKDLQAQDVILESRLEAAIAFCLGESDFAKNRIDAALGHYNQSLEFWQAENSQEPLREGVLRERIGLCYASQKNWTAAKNELQASLEIFAEEECLDLLDRLTGELGEVLRKLNAWDELEILAQQSLERDGSNAARRADDYGFLAEVALDRQQWEEAKKYAGLALDTWTETPVPARFFLMLARAWQELGDPRQAIACLKEGKDKAQPQDDPQLYVDLLRELRDRLYERGEYWKAFAVRKFRREVRYQFGLRAFIGPGLSQQRRIEGFGEITSTLAASGRKQDIDALVARISQPRHKLTVLYGPSGVGKSSLVQAGLVPVLQDSVIDRHYVLPVVVRAYADWVKELGIQLNQALEHSQRSAPNSLEALKAQLQSHADRYLTVLIFDQFEEFFFICDKPGERREFYQFLADCLRGTEVKFVKVILSLREDYLHELLELEAFLDRPELESDILGRDQRYYLGNYSRATARSVIEDLTGQTQLRLEDGLVNALVEDLADELGEIRPIELQVVGAQLESKGINTLGQYRALGDNPKSDLAKGWIEDVVRDCGTENIDGVWQLLTALTSEKMTRPLRTATELSKELETYRKLTEGKNIPLEDLILKILVGSGLVVQWHQEPEYRYQLVHDYLVEPIRQKYNADYRQRIEEADEKRKQAEVARQKAEADRIRFLKLSIAGGVVAFVILACTTIWALVSAKKSTEAKQNAIAWAEEAEEEKQKAEKEKQKAIARQLAAKSERLREQHGSFYTASGLLAVESANIVLEIEENSPETDIALHKSLHLRSKFSELLADNTSVNPVTFSRCDRWVANKANDRITVRILDAPTGVEIARLEHSDDVNAVSFSRDCRRVATASDDNTARIWNPQTGVEIARLPHDEDVWAISFSSEDAFVTTASADGTARIWAARAGAEIAHLPHSGNVYAVSFSSDGRRVATASGDGTVLIWNAQTLRPIDLIANLQHDGPVEAVSFSSDDAKVATASIDKTARIWNAQTGELIARLPHDGYVLAVSFSSDGRRVATASADKTARIWNAQTGKLIARLQHDNAVRAISFSSDNAKVATASDDFTARIWNAQTGSEIARLPHDNFVRAVSFSSDDAKVATASWDRTARIWNAQTGAEIARLPHEEAIYAVSFSSDDAKVATASWDDTARIWNGQTGTEIFRLEHEDNVYAVSFSSDSRWVATASWDGTARIWPLSISDLRDELCRRLTRNLTANEWKQYVYPKLENYRLTCPQHPVHPSVLEEAVELAKTGNAKHRRTALAIFQRAKKLQSDIDLDPTTKTVETDPKEIVESAQ